MKICALIPSYNEERTIADVVKKVRDMGIDVVVVDDGSTDNTERVASLTGATVMRHQKNLGKGASLKEGFDFILRMTGFDTVLVMDGDGQHDPADIPRLISRMEKEGSDIVIGNRMNRVGNMPLIRIATNRFMSVLLSLLCRQRIPDTQCGFRLIRRGVLEKIKLTSDKYDLESEMLIKASRHNFRIASVPIETIYRNEKSGINPFKDTIRFIMLLARSLFGA